MLDKFSDELRAVREEKNITLEQIAAKTRIDPKFLEAIDQGNFSFLPELYVKAFLKQYAKVLDLDEEETVKKYELAKEGKDYHQEKVKEEENNTDKKAPALIKTSPPPAKSYVDESTKRSSSSGNEENKSKIIIGVGGVLLVVTILALYFFIFKDSDSIIVEETPIEDVIEQTRERYVEDEPEITTEDTLQQIISSDSLYLTISSSEKSWIQVIKDNRTTEEFMLDSSNLVSLQAASEFKITIGNAGGINLYLNNKPLEFNGRSGEVRYVKVDQNGIGSFSPPSSEPKQQ